MNIQIAFINTIILTETADSQLNITDDFSFLK